MFATKERKGGGEWKARILSSCERFHSPVLNNCSEFSPLGLASACPCSGTPSYGAKREDNLFQDCRDISNRGAGRGASFFFSLFFFACWKKKWKKIPSSSSRGGMGSDYSREALSIPTSNRLVWKGKGRDYKAGEHCGD